MKKTLLTIAIFSSTLAFTSCNPGSEVQEGSETQNIFAGRKKERTWKMKTITLYSKFIDKDLVRFTNNNGQPSNIVLNEKYKNQLLAEFLQAAQNHDNYKNFTQKFEDYKTKCRKSGHTSFSHTTTPSMGYIHDYVGHYDEIRIKAVYTLNSKFVCKKP